MHSSRPDSRPVDAVDATTATHGDRPEDKDTTPSLSLSLSPSHSKGSQRSNADLSPPAPVTTQAPRMQKNDIGQTPNVGSSAVLEAKAANAHETFLQGGDEAQLIVTGPSAIIRSSVPAPAFAHSPTPNALPIHPSPASKSSLPTLSSSDFMTSYPQASTNTMIFSHGNGAAHRRRSMATTSALTEYEADLTSKDRLKQKEAIKNILAVKVRADWSFPDKVDESALQPSEAPPEGDLTAWIERAEWLSEVSNSEDEDDALTKTTTVSTTESENPAKAKGKGAKSLTNPFRFDNPDSVGETLRKTTERRKLRRQRKLNAELTYNEGLRCFVARRNAWTGARIVRKPRGTALSLSANGNKSGTPCEKPCDQQKDQDHEEEDDETILDTLLPIAPPLLPPDTPMRRNITARAYSTIYDKVVLQSQTPFCPINLQTVVSSCVEGWKRDGEWPPKGTEPEASLARRRNAEAAAAQKGMWRRSLQRVFGRAGTDIL